MARGRPSKKIVILDTAERLFSELGYQSTTIDLVVKEADVSKPTIYNNFPSKQVLFQELILRKNKQKQEEQKLLLMSELDIEDKIYQIFHKVILSPFELSICKIYYGEAHKLNDDCLSLCQTFDQLLTRSVFLILAPLNYSKEIKFSILSVYKNGILMNKLSHQEPITSLELKEIYRVLVKMSTEV